MTPEEIAIMQTQVNVVATEIGAKLDEERRPWAARDHSRNNWASEIGHPCRKKLVHCRLDWREKEGIDLDGRWRVDEGKRIEWEVIKWLGNIGYKVDDAEKYFVTDDYLEYRDLHISGKIDGVIPLNRKLPAPFENLKEVKVEIKTVNPNYWNSTKTIEDIKRHRAWWIQGYPSQLNTYLAFDHDPIGLFILVTFGKKPRILPMLFDQDLWDHDKAKVEAVNAHVAAGTYPEPIPFDAQICGMCDFHHICNPLQTTKMSEIDSNDKFVLELYLEEKENNKRFKKLHDELIGDKKKPGKYRGIDAIIEDIEIVTRYQTRKTYAYPPEVKEAHRGEDSEVIITTIERRGE